MHAQGEYAEALESFQKALMILIKVLGEQHPDVATSYNNIGGALGSQGKHSEALVHHQKALTIELNVLGEEHPSPSLQLRIGFPLKFLSPNKKLYFVS